MKLIFIDPQHERHFLTLLRRNSTHGFYECVTEQGKPLVLHHDQILAHLEPSALDQLLDGDMVPITYVIGSPLCGKTELRTERMWTEWRNDAPVFGRKIEVLHDQCGTRFETLHSAGEIASLMERGWRSWRYA